jgi:hypothetical protein
MRGYAARLAIVAALCSVAAILCCPASGSAGGRLVGVTKITYGCPGPQRVGQPCEHWSFFPNARFVLTRDRVDRTPITSTRRVVVSDGKGAFSLPVVAGLYTITPLPQKHTRGGNPLTVRVRAGQTLRVTVRFLGFPMME